MIVDKILLKKFVNGFASDEESAECEAYLQSNDASRNTRFELDTDVENDTLLRSLRQSDGSNDFDLYDKISEKINERVQKKLGVSEITNYLRPAESVDEIGRLAEYRLLEKIGSGGMGVVFAAENLDSQERVAIKLMNPLMASNPHAAERFRREVRSAAKLSHPRIVKILDQGCDAGIPFFTMELLSGEPLGDLLKRQERVAPNRVRELVLQILEGLEYAEQQGIQHRDIKPDNLWLDENGDVVILDFGLARGADDGTGLTKTGDVLGTPQYMAPEQVTGMESDCRTDLFSLGAVMYELLTGKSKFADQNVYSTLMAVTNRPVSADELLASDCPSDLAALVVNLLEKNPENRPANARSVRQRLLVMQLTQTSGRSGNGRGKTSRWFPGFCGGFIAAAAIFVLTTLVFFKTDRGILVVEAGEGVEVTTLKDGISIRMLDTDKRFKVKIG